MWQLTNSIFFLSEFSFTDTDDSQDTGKERRPSFCSTLPLPPDDKHSDIYLQLCMWDNYHIFFNYTGCIYQTATRWDLPPYRTTIWLIDDLMLIFVLVLQANRLTKCKKIKPKHWAKGKIGVAAQSWRWLWVELMAWEPSQWGSTPTQATFL